MSESRTEAATPQRLARARQEGTVALSHELGPLFALAAMTALLMLGGGVALRRLTLDLAGLVRLAGRADGAADIGVALRLAGWDGLRALSAVFAVALLAGPAATLVQTGFLIRPEGLLPDWSRLSPGRGLRRVFGTASAIAVARSLVKAAIVAVVAWRQLVDGVAGLAASVLHGPGALPASMLAGVTRLLIAAVLVQAGAALADVLLTRLRHARSLRMSRDELRQEAREANGSPEIKARIRRLRSQRARRRMAVAVRAATVVVTNPTHYAVALEYDQTRRAAPRVVAKGVDEMAARIRAVAEQHRVPLVANPPLARALHRVELDADIPPELYQAVAEIIAYVWRLRGRAHG